MRIGVGSLGKRLGLFPFFAIALLWGGTSPRLICQKNPAFSSPDYYFSPQLHEMIKSFNGLKTDICKRH